ncbi:MAG: hypothetical protein A2X12_11490 [Bacteroidetes bacterium GWE2_29_8]|nr:MAG: hypothetical protein A2X12_11490 [Bacteroidetes bacterium GWE2_29_8]OFY13975.1 MAG: hypothetical protein A2X02_09140 [Bacteroidetes bacterium GWF2_29_10]
MAQKKQGLGRGIDSVLGGSAMDVQYYGNKDAEPESIVKINLDKIEANPFQPRVVFEESGINELAESIKSQGIIQPITVRKMGYNQYQIVSGERRVRASKQAGLTDIPAYIIIASDQEMLEKALVENLQRRDLNPIEVSNSYKRLIDECKITQEELSVKVGKERSTITNYLRLLKLPEEIQDAISMSSITMGHARAIINIEDKELQLLLFNDIVSNNLSVRNVEEAVRKLNEKNREENKIKTKIVVSPTLTTFTKTLSGVLGVKVKVKNEENGKGSIVIHYNSEDELNRIISILNNE